MSWHTRIPARQLRLALASAIGVSALALVWVGYRAVVEWQHAAGLVATRRAASAADLLVSALSRDMRGAHSVLLQVTRENPGFSPADLMHPVAGAFTRYPYAEAFFSWRAGTENGVVFYHRVESRPAWLTSSAFAALYPVATGADRTVSQHLLERLSQDAEMGRRLSAFTTTIGGDPYQVVASLAYPDPRGERPDAVLGYLVNLRLSREHYFSTLAAQVAAIEGTDGGVRFSIVDDRGAAVVGTPSQTGTDAPAATRVFPAAFFDPAAVAVDPPADLGLVSWTARATAEDDVTLAAAERGARRTLAIAGVMTLTLAVGLIVSLRAARASAELAVMRADFVSAITHELKTPLANMRAISETLASGRTTPDMVREYASMGVGETTRLTRLVDNLLAYARVTDVADVYTFEAVPLAAVVQRSLQEFATVLRRERFVVDVDLPDDLPPVHGDLHALGLLLNNLVDNAVRYSKDERHISVRASAHSTGVTLAVSDRGAGIRPDELDRVTRKFFRGRDSVAGGSGLGLAIVDRIVADHGGTMSIVSTEGQGTTVSVTIPAATS